MSVATAPFAVTVNWAGTYSSSTFTGFKSVDIYAVNSDLGSSVTSGITNTNLVGSLTVNNTPNKINVSLDNLRQALGLSTNSDVYSATIFYYFNATNTDGTKFGSPTYTRINSSSVVPTKANFVDLVSGVISIENLVAGNGNFSSWLRTGTAGGARIELSAVNNFTDSGNTVQKGMTAYSSGSTEVFKLDLATGALTINGSGTFSGALSAATGTFAGALSAATGSFSGTITATGGTIGGIYIAAGAIQNDVGGSQFKLDSSGKARFGSATGNAIVINPTASNGGYYLYHTSGGDSGSASSAFSISTSGILTATGANFSGTITNSTSSDYWNSNGTFRFGGSSGISYSGGTITMGSSVTMPAAQITGTITANAIVSNATITSPTIAGGIFRTASSGQRIVINETANQIDIYPDSSSSPGYISASTVSSYGSLKLASPYASGFSQSNIQLYSLGSSLAYIQLTANVTSLTGGLTVSAGSLFSGDADFSSNIIATGAVNAATLTPAPNTYITTGGQIRRTSGSSIRYKKDIVDLLTVEDLNPNKLYSLPVRAFKYKEEFTSSDDSRYNKLLPGFIAEEVEEIYSIAADYDINGVEKWNSNIMIPAMLSLIQDLNRRLDALEG